MTKKILSVILSMALFASIMVFSWTVTVSAATGGVKLTVYQFGDKTSEGVVGDKSEDPTPGPELDDDMIIKTIDNFNDFSVLTGDLNKFISDILEETGKFTNPDNKDLKNVALVLTGTFKAPASGDYNFKIKTDNGHYLKINDKVISDYWNYNWEVDKTGSVSLEKDKEYSFELRYFTGWGGSLCKVEMQVPGGDFAPLDATYLTNATTGGGTTGGGTTGGGTTGGGTTGGGTTGGGTTGGGTSNPKTGDVSAVLAIIATGAAAFGGLKLRKK